MASGSNICSDVVLQSVLTGFYKFLVIKIAERVQQISREQCAGCVGGFVLDQLHPCMKLALIAKVEKFLPKAKYEALTRLDKLYEMYAKTTLLVEGVAYKEAGEDFIEFLQPHHVLDRRYVNEDSVFEYPFDPSWLMDESPETQIPLLGSTLPPIKVLEPTTVKHRKRKRPETI